MIDLIFDLEVMNLSIMPGGDISFTSMVTTIFATANCSTRCRRVMLSWTRRYQKIFVILMRKRKFILVPAASVVLAIIAALFPTPGAPARIEDPDQVVREYLRSSLARDYSKAYQFISSADRRHWDERGYILQQHGLSGFALALAAMLAEDMEVWIIERRNNPGRIRFRIGYRIPTADELAAELFNWDQKKLNALTPLAQRRLLEKFAQLKKAPERVTVAGEKTIDLIDERGRWRVFLDWASHRKVSLRLALPPSGEIAGKFRAPTLLVKPDEPFEAVLMLKNLIKKPVVASIVHRFEPDDFKDQLDMLICGALLPLRLEAGAEQEIVTVYLLRDVARPRASVSIIYGFKLERPERGATP